MMGLTYWPRLLDPQGRRARASWPAIVARLTVPRIVEVKLDAPGFALATFAGDRRALANVEHVYAVGLDLDKQVPSWDELCARFAASSAFLHTTWSSTPDDLRARVFIPTSRPVTGDEYRRVYAATASKVEAGGLVVDRNASDPSRFWFLPSVRHGASFACFLGTGGPIDVDAALAAVPPPAPPAAPLPPSGTYVCGNVEARAEAYLARCEPAIEGSGGDAHTFQIALKMTRGFGLDPATAYRLMCPWNATCSPPWSEYALRRKIREAAERGQMQEGALRDAQRGR